MEQISQLDLQQIWTWNSEVPTVQHACIHDLFSETARNQPFAPSVNSWDGDLTYETLDVLSNRLASHLIQLGIRPEENAIIPLCFEKSKWMPVAILAALKT